MKPITKHRSVHYAKTPRQLELEGKYQYNRLVGRLIKDIRNFIERGSTHVGAKYNCEMALEEAKLESDKLYGNR